MGPRGLTRKEKRQTSGFTSTTLTVAPAYSETPRNKSKQKTRRSLVPKTRRCNDRRVAPNIPSCSPSSSTANMDKPADSPTAIVRATESPFATDSLRAFDAAFPANTDGKLLSGLRTRGQQLIFQMHFPDLYRKKEEENEAVARERGWGTSNIVLSEAHMLTLSPLVDLAVATDVARFVDVTEAFEAIIALVGREDGFMEARNQLRDYIVVRRTTGARDCTDLRHHMTAWWTLSPAKGKKSGIWKAFASLAGRVEAA